VSKKSKKVTISILFVVVLVVIVSIIIVIETQKGKRYCKNEIIPLIITKLPQYWCHGENFEMQKFHGAIILTAIFEQPTTQGMCHHTNCFFDHC